MSGGEGTQALAKGTIMTLDKIGRLLAGAVLATSMFAVSIPAPALAQSARGGDAVAVPDPALPQPVPGKVITLPCCKCIGGESQVVNLNSGSGAGSVPFNVAGPGVGNPIAQTITNNIHPLWTASLPPAQWIHANNNNGSSAQPAGTYQYTVRIRVPKCTIPMRVNLAGQAAADDQLKVFVDDLQTSSSTQIGATPTTAITSPPPVPANAGGWGFRAERITMFTWSTNIPGTYVLRFEVVNGPGPTGLLVRAAVKTVCPTNLQQD